MVIRELRKSDIKACVAICDANYNGQYHSQINKELHRMFDKTFFVRPTYYVAEIDGKILAFAGFAPTGFDYNIYGLFWVNTHPEHLGGKIGLKVVKHIVSGIRRKMIDTKKPGCILLTCLKPLERYYSKLSFKTITTTGDELVMCIHLNQPEVPAATNPPKLMPLPGSAVPLYSGQKIVSETRHYPIYNFETNKSECFYCEEGLDNKFRTKDHVHPKRLGGKIIIGNWVYACGRCNGLKSGMLLQAFVVELNYLLHEARTEPDLIGTGASAYYQRVLNKVNYMISKLYPDATD